MKFVRLLVSLCLLSVAPGVRADIPDPTCDGRFFNPITDICWSCVLPLRIAGSKVLSMDQEDNESSDGVDSVCACTGAGIPRVGLMTSFFEPARLVEVVRTPYCFITLGGTKIDFGIDAPAHAQTAHKSGRTVNAFYNVHWYTNPLIFWLEVLLDDVCLERGTFDLAYLTELDPLWADSISTFILNPDIVLFANPVAQAACAADCVAASSGFPLKELYWCAGCQGPLLPHVGHVAAKTGAVQAATLLAQRMTSKLHREGLIWAGGGSDGSCSLYPQPVMDKTNYKMQMVYPIPNTKKIDGRCCQPFGRTTVIWGAGKEYPYKGEDFSFQIFRKRDCCSGNLIKAVIQ